MLSQIREASIGSQLLNFRHASKYHDPSERYELPTLPDLPRYCAASSGRRLTGVQTNRPGIRVASAFFYSTGEVQVQGRVSKTMWCLP